MIKKLLLLTLLSLQLYATDAKLLHLSLEVMLYNNDLENAYKIAKEGMKLYPDDLWWKERVADIATWLQKVDEAKVYNQQLYSKSYDKKYADKLLNISKATNDKRLELDVLEHQLLKKHDLKMAKKVFELYDYLGFLKRGEEFFKKLYKKYKDKEFLKLSILLQADFDEYKPLIKSLRSYEKVHGFDKDILLAHARELYKKRRYKQVFKLLNSYKGNFSPKDKKLWKLYTNVAYILQKEHTLFLALKESNKAKVLPKNSIPTLITLAKKEDEKLELSLVEKDYKDILSKNSFYRYLSLVTNLKGKSVKEVLNSIPKNLEKELEKDSYFWTLKAQSSNSKIAKSYYKKALSLHPNSPDIHVAYLWYLIEIEDRVALKNELNFIEKHFSNNQDALLPLSLGYFNLQQSQKAKLYMSRLLRQKPNDWQLYLFYADVLSLWGDDEGRDSYFLSSWIMAQMDKNKNGLDKNKEYDFARLKNYFAPYQVFRNVKNEIARVKYSPFYLTQNNPRNNNFANAFSEVITSKTPTIKLSLSHINRGELKYQQLEASFKRRYKNFDTIFELRRKENLKNDDTSLWLKLENSFKNYDVGFLVGLRQRCKADILFNSYINYRYRRFSLQTSFGINKEDELTNYMLLYGRKNQFKLHGSYLLTKRDNFDFGYEHSAFKNCNTTLGSSDGLNFSYKHYFHLAYPDIYYRIFADTETYDKKSDKLPQDYWQSGLEFGYGVLAKDKFSRSFKPYASTNILYNNQSKLGYSITVGLGGRVRYKDYLGIELLYADGIGTRMEEYFRFRLAYMFW